MTNQKTVMPTKDIPLKELMKACKKEIFLTEMTTIVATVSIVATAIGFLNGTFAGFGLAAIFIWPAGTMPFFVVASETMLEGHINREYEAHELAPAFPKEQKRVLFFSHLVESH